MIRTAGELGPLRGRSRRLLAVFPHPDDEAYGCAGTLARLGQDPEAATVLLCLTRGEASQMGPERGMSPEEVGALREARLQEVGRILRLDGLLVGNLPDSRMARCGLDELAAPIREAMDAFRPQVVINHDARGVNAHPDHIATHWAIRHALLHHPAARFAMLGYPAELVEAIKPRLLFPTAEEELDAILHLTDEEIDAKEACLRIHEALVTLIEGVDPNLLKRPPIERYDFLDEEFDPPLDDLFAKLPDA